MEKNSLLKLGFLILILGYINGCSSVHVIDLTWPLDNETVFWNKNTQKFTFTRQIAGERNGYWYAMNDFCIGEHVGTHLDAPYHFYESGWKVGDVPPHRLVAKGALIDLQNKVSKLGHATTLDVSDLEQWEKAHGTFNNETILLIKFGWSKYWYNRTLYMGSEDEKLNFPGISEEAAEWLANSGKFYGIGVDTASVDPGSTKDFKAHVIFSKNQMYNLENVMLVDDSLPAKGFTVVALPMKIKEGTGAPVRILAIPD
ncbi:unnamed protein product [Callosobruchus maculatus]|uniref:Cyclase family protein n=1 Tax=Callosobruchus maculatus TaxID=64391 RepID=A0A653D8A1_CALMS|nr:unnamed protein product [Callosobruchus maculatus]